LLKTLNQEVNLPTVFCKDYFPNPLQGCYFVSLFVLLQAKMITNNMLTKDIFHW